MFKKYLFPLLIVLISFIILGDLFKSGLPITHDGQDHVARIANFYQSLSEGNLIPRWAGNLNWGYGHPILQFLYPLPSYLASIFHFLGFTLVDSVKLVFGFSFILSGLTMYLFIKELLNDEKTAFLAGLLYMIAPYRLVDLYVRGAIGEHVAFIFPPLVFYFLFKLSKQYSWWHLMGGAISFALLNLSHNAISLMFVPLFGLYGLYLLFQSERRIQLTSIYLVTVLLGFGLSAFFWIPAFVEGRYTLRDIVTGSGEYIASFVAWKDFFIPSWSYGGTLTLSKQIGLMHWVVLSICTVGIYKLYKKKNSLWIIGLGSFIIFWITLFLMTAGSSPIWQSVTTLQKFQFPWRLLSVTVFISAFLGAIALCSFSNKLNKLFLFIFVVSLLLINKDYWRANGFLEKEDSFYTGIYNSTTDTGESAPIWSVRFMEKRPKARVEVIDGDAEIKEVKRTATNRKYEISASERSTILENTLYFPGWTVLVDSIPTKIEFQDPTNRGLMTFDIDKGVHEVYIQFGETKLRTIANLITGISLIIIFTFIFVNLIKKRRN